MIICPHHWYYDQRRLAQVTARMRVLGQPVLRGFHDEESDAVLLREGTHRIRAAQALGVVPVIRRIPWWRSRKSLERARYAAAERGLVFPLVLWDIQP